MGWTRRQFSKRRKAICAAQLLKRPLQLGVDFTELARCFLDLSSMCAFVIRQDAGYRSDGKEHQDLDELIDAVLGWEVQDIRIWGTHSRAENPAANKPPLQPYHNAVRMMGM